jgi:hypothetical protein
MVSAELNCHPSTCCGCVTVVLCSEKEERKKGESVVLQHLEQRWFLLRLNISAAQRVNGSLMCCYTIFTKRSRWMEKSHIWARYPQLKEENLSFCFMELSQPQITFNC